MRKFLIIVAVLVGLAIGYLAGCRSHIQAHHAVPDPEPGQVWVDHTGHERVVRTVTHECDKAVVYWHRPGSSGVDRHCGIRAWRQWVRNRGARVEP